MIIYTLLDISKIENDINVLNHISQEIINLMTIIPVKQKHKPYMRDTVKKETQTNHATNPNKKKKDLCNEIQSEINKVSEKNYDAQFKKINEAMNYLQSNDEAKYIIAITKAYKLLSNNVFLVDTYSKLYIGLVKQHTQLSDLLQRDFLLYEDSLEKMIYDVSQDQSEYEQFCDKNTIKLNMIGLTVFFIKLCDLKNVDKSTIQKLCLRAQNILWQKINNPETIEEDVEFLSSIIHTIFKSGFNILKDDPHEFDFIKSNINRIINNYKIISSISNKLYFKHLDINDIIKS
jgi:hypothetical protein